MRKVLKQIAIVAVVGALAYVVYVMFIGGGHSDAPTLTEARPSDEKIAYITHEKPVPLEAFADPEGVTIFEFTAPG